METEKIGDGQQGRCNLGGGRGGRGRQQHHRYYHPEAGGIRRKINEYSKHEKARPNNFCFRSPAELAALANLTHGPSVHVSAEKRMFGSGLIGEPRLECRFAKDSCPIFGSVWLEREAVHECLLVALGRIGKSKSKATTIGRIDAVGHPGNIAKL